MAMENLMNLGIATNTDELIASISVPKNPAKIREDKLRHQKMNDKYMRLMSQLESEMLQAKNQERLERRLAK